MKPRLFGTAVALLAALAVVTCKDDPTASLSGGATRLLISPNPILVSEGATSNFTVQAVNDALRGIASTYDATSPDAGIATVAKDTANPDPSRTTQRFFVSAVAPGQVVLSVTGAGLTGQDTVNVLPLVFAGAASTLTPAGGDTLTIGNTAVLDFDPASVQVSFGDVPGPVVAAAVDNVAVLVPFVNPGPLTINGIAVTYVAGLVTTLSTPYEITVTGDAWVGDDAIATAPPLPIPAAAGDTSYMITNVTTVDNAATCPEVVLGFGSAGPCMIYKFTLAQTTSLSIEVDWDSDADMDIYVCPDADPNNCYEDGGGGATGAQPEITSAEFSPGDHYLFIERYSGSAPKNINVTISRQ